jgi:uncharacterized protein GlcG (DUF336 family)
MLALALAGLGGPALRTLAFVSFGLLASILRVRAGRARAEGHSTGSRNRSRQNGCRYLQGQWLQLRGCGPEQRSHSNHQFASLQDGSRPNTMDGARRKAYTALKSTMTSMDFGKSIGLKSTRLKPGDPPTQFGVIDGDPSLIPFGGGVPIKISGHLVAAIAASGAPDQTRTKPAPRQVLPAADFDPRVENARDHPSLA